MVVFRPLVAFASKPARFDTILSINSTTTPKSFKSSNYRNSCDADRRRLFRITAAELVCDGWDSEFKGDSTLIDGLTESSWVMKLNEYRELPKGTQAMRERDPKVLTEY
jgi:hypothetical protein